MGPRKKTQIPFKVRTDEGFITNETEVLNAWKSDFSNLYNCPNKETDEFLNNILNENIRFEASMNNNYYVENEEINQPITQQ